MDLVRFRVDLAPGCSLGPGKIALLEAIDDRGSLTRAAAALGMSYRYAWLLLNDLRNSFTEALTTASVGGRHGGGVELTDFGKDVVRRYRKARERIDAVARAEFAPIVRRARRAPPAGSPRGARLPARDSRGSKAGGTKRSRSIKRAGPVRTGAETPR
jgi:molybdate transport system regulatory protein